MEVQTEGIESLASSIRTLANLMAIFVTMVGLFVVMMIVFLVGKVLGNHLVENCKQAPKEAV